MDKIAQVHTRFVATLKKQSITKDGYYNLKLKIPPKELSNLLKVIKYKEREFPILISENINDDFESEKLIPLYGFEFKKITVASDAESTVELITQNNDTIQAIIQKQEAYNTSDFIVIYILAI